MTGLIMLIRSSDVSVVAVWFCCDGFCLLVVCLRVLLFVFAAVFSGVDEPKSMRTTKMRAMSGSTRAASILLRSAGVFPSNRAINLNSLPPSPRRFGKTSRALLSLRGRGCAAEVCGHVEAQADECAARGRGRRHDRLRARHRCPFGVDGSR